MREYFVLSRYYKNKRSERLWKEIDWETPSVRERLLMWGEEQRARKTEGLYECVSEKKRDRKGIKGTGSVVCEKVEKIEVASDSDGLWDRERETRERNRERLWIWVCVRGRETDRQKKLREKEREIETDREREGDSERKREKIHWGRRRWHRERLTDSESVCMHLSVRSTLTVINYERERESKKK